ncbi:MAG: hypothetical protein BV456_01735 [Thermoplasmata archaeon M8B2D]|nr:MAG: hypothetical protein BV456_01735 [Thermoplasmata archaeon M8B2D]
MFYHKKCGNILRAEISSDAVKLLATFSISGKFTAQIKELLLWKTGISKIPISYYCTNCDSTISEEADISFLCNGCGKEFDISEIRVPTESGGIFCEKCSKKFEEHEKLYAFFVKDIKI